MIHVVFTDLLACLCILAGLFFMLVGAIGIVRFPDGFNRLHASSKCSTLGLLGLLLGALRLLARHETLEDVARRIESPPVRAEGEP